MSRDAGATVPKFGSFKPRVTKETRPPSKREGSRKRNEHGSAKRQRRHRADDGSISHENDKQKPHNSRHEVSGIPDPSTEAPCGEELFFVDVRGDRQNLEYGSLHRWTVPAYYRSGFGSVIGAPSHVKIERDTSTEKEAVLRAAGKLQVQRSLFSSKKRFSSGDPPMEVLAKGAHGAETQKDFIDLSSEQSTAREELIDTDTTPGIWSFIECGIPSHVTEDDSDHG